MKEGRALCHIWSLFDTVIMVIICHKLVCFYSHTEIPILHDRHNYSIWAITNGIYLSLLSSTIGYIRCAYCNVYNLLQPLNARTTSGRL